MTLYYSVLIIGGGLIGSSLARAIKANKLAERIYIADADDKACDAIRDLDLADNVSNDFTEFVGNADLVILATPPGVMKAIGAQIVERMKTGAVLSDVG